MYEVQENGCWHFTGTINQANNYGTCRGTGAHRYFYEQMVGPIPDGMHIDHMCHVPGECAGGFSCLHRRCVNPAHLEPVTPRENVLRSNSFVATNASLTHCPSMHPYEGDNLIITSGPRSQRLCRTCLTESDRRHKAERKARGYSPANAKPVHLRLLAELVTPMTDYEAAQVIGVGRQTVALHRSELAVAGLVAPTGTRPRSIHRRPAIVWQVTA